MIPSTACVQLAPKKYIKQNIIDSIGAFIIIMCGNYMIYLSGFCSLVGADFGPPNGFRIHSEFFTT